MVAGELGDQPPRFDDLPGVEAGRRLVENQDLGVVQQGLGQADPLPVPLGQRAAPALGHVGDGRAFHGRPDARGPVSGGDAVDAGHEMQVLADGHFRIQGRRLGQIARPALGLEGLVEDVETGDPGMAFGGRQVAGQDAHRRGLAGPVGAEEAQNLAGFDLEAQVVHGRERPVALGHVLHFDHAAFSPEAMRRAAARRTKPGERGLRADGRAE